jgi:hypothetical protein
MTPLPMWVMVLDAAIFGDEASFNLAKTLRRGWNLIGQWVTVQLPGQRGGNISMCAAISEDGVVGRRPLLGSYNASRYFPMNVSMKLSRPVKLRG